MGSRLKTLLFISLLTICFYGVGQYGVYSSAMNQMWSDMVLQNAMPNNFMFGYYGTASKPKYVYHKGTVNLKNGKIISGRVKMVSGTKQFRKVILKDSLKNKWRFFPADIQSLQIKGKDTAVVFTSSNNTEIINIDGQLFRVMLEGDYMLADNFYKVDEETTSPSYYEMRLKTYERYIKVDNFKQVAQKLTHNKYYAALLDSILSDRNSDLSLIYDYVNATNQVLSGNHTIPKMTIYANGNSVIELNGTILPYDLIRKSKRANSFFHGFKGSKPQLLESSNVDSVLLSKDSKQIMFKRYDYNKKSVFGYEFSYKEESYIAIHAMDKNTKPFSDSKNVWNKAFTYLKFNKKNKLHKVGKKSYLKPKLDKRIQELGIN